MHHRIASSAKMEIRPLDQIIAGDEERFVYHAFEGAVCHISPFAGDMSRNLFHSEGRSFGVRL